MDVPFKTETQWLYKTATQRPHRTEAQMIIQNSNINDHTKQQHKWPGPYKTATPKKPYKEFKTTAYKLSKSLLKEP